jgi:hypothetical protein
VAGRRKLHNSELEVFALPERYTLHIGSCLQTFRHNVFVPTAKILFTPRRLPEISNLALLIFMRFANMHNHYYNYLYHKRLENQLDSPPEANKF